MRHGGQDAANFDGSPRANVSVPEMSSQRVLVGGKAACPSMGAMQSVAAGGRVPPFENDSTTPEKARLRQFWQRSHNVLTDCR